MNIIMFIIGFIVIGIYLLMVLAPYILKLDPDFRELEIALKRLKDPHAKYYTTDEVKDILEIE